jgi:hypothetical protein
LAGSGRYTVTVRAGSRVQRNRFGDLNAALAEIEALARRLAKEADGRAVDLKALRRIEPVQRVMARIELAGPGRLRAGIDVRGDGSTEGYTGRLRRRLIEQRRGESPYDALRRAVS